MAVSQYETIHDIIRGLEEGELSHLDVLAHTMAILTPENVDETMAAMPEPPRALFVEWTRGLIAPKGRIVRVGRGVPIPQHPQARDAIHGWLVRNGLLPRTAAA